MHMMYIWYARLYLCTLFETALDLDVTAKMLNTLLQMGLKITRGSESSVSIRRLKWWRGKLMSDIRIRIARLWRNAIILDTKLDFIAPIAQSKTQLTGV